MKDKGLDPEGFDALKLARTLDLMADRQTRPGTLPRLAEAIEDVRRRWPKSRLYPAATWVAAWRDHLAAHPVGDPARCLFARTWVEGIDGASSEATATMIDAEMRRRRWAQRRA